MIENHWYDVLILVVKYDQGRLELRLGIFCLLVIVVVIWKVVRAFINRNSAD
jgi:hypothetical protein